MSQTVIYEITAVVRAELASEYERYMRERHIPDLLKTGYFHGANFTRSSENRCRVGYEALNQTALDAYLKNDAERFRADFLAHFPEGVELSREVWQVLHIWDTDA